MKINMFLPLWNIHSYESKTTARKRDVFLSEVKIKAYFYWNFIIMFINSLIKVNFLLLENRKFTGLMV